MSEQKKLLESCLSNLSIKLF